MVCFRQGAKCPKSNYSYEAKQSSQLQMRSHRKAAGDGNGLSKHTAQVSQFASAIELGNPEGWFTCYPPNVLESFPASLGILKKKANCLPVAAIMTGDTCLRRQKQNSVYNTRTQALNNPMIPEQSYPRLNPPKLISLEGANSV